MSELTVIGRAEKVSFPGLGVTGVPAKVDTGADLSTIWAGQVEEKSDGLHCVFFAPSSKYHSGQEVIFAPGAYSVTRIASSFGQKQIRYKVKLGIVVKGRRIKATFTLSNRASKTYPVLIGRRLLRNKFLVDVAQGAPLIQVEEMKKQKMKQELARRGYKEV